MRLAGPVVSAAVMLGMVSMDGLDDSKRLSPARRAELAAIITKECVSHSDGMASVEKIDELNILSAKLNAMQRAVAGIVIVPDEVLADGNVLPDLPYPCEAIVVGDAKVPEIMAASIIAKHTRDTLMTELDRVVPGYGFAQL